MSRFCTHPDHTFIELESDADISLHILEHVVTNEAALTELKDAIATLGAQIMTAFADLPAAISADVEKIQAGWTAIIDENTALKAEVASLQSGTVDLTALDGLAAQAEAVTPAPAPAAVDPSTIVDPSTGLLPDGTQPAA